MLGPAAFGLLLEWTGGAFWVGLAGAGGLMLPTFLLYAKATQLTDSAMHDGSGYGVIDAEQVES